jgi:hypothetical protein
MKNLILNAILAVSLFAAAQTAVAQGVQVQAPSAQEQKQIANLSKAEVLKLAEQANDQKLVDLIKNSSDASFKTIKSEINDGIPAVGAPSVDAQRCYYIRTFIGWRWVRFKICI